MLGIIVNLSTGTIKIPDKRIQKLFLLLSQLDLNHTLARKLAKVAGSIISTSPASSPTSRFQTRAEFSPYSCYFKILVVDFCARGTRITHSLLSASAQLLPRLDICDIIRTSSIGGKMVLRQQKPRLTTLDSTFGCLSGAKWVLDYPASLTSQVQVQLFSDEAVRVVRLFELFERNRNCFVEYPRRNCGCHGHLPFGNLTEKKTYRPLLSCDRRCPC